MATTKVYNGSSWVDTVIKAWNGSAWMDRFYYYDGAAFQEMNELLVDLVTLSGQANTAFSFGSAATAYFKWDQDGNSYQKDNAGSYTQYDTVADWLRPIVSAPGLYEIRITSLSETGNAGTFFSTAAENTWYSLSSGDFICSMQTIGTGLQNAIANFTVEIRENGGATLDTGAFTLTANREDF